MKKIILVFICLMLFGCQAEDINNIDESKFKFEIVTDKVSNRTVNNDLKLSTDFKEINILIDGNKYTLEESLNNNVITIEDIKDNMTLIDTLVDCTKVYKASLDFSNIEFYLYDCWVMHISDTLTTTCPIASVTPIEGC